MYLHVYVCVCFYTYFEAYINWDDPGETIIALDLEININIFSFICELLFPLVCLYYSHYSHSILWQRYLSLY